MSRPQVRKSDQAVQLNREIDNLFAACKSDVIEMDLLVHTMRMHIRYTLWWRQLQYFAAVAALITIAYYVPIVSANLTAIGRIWLIKMLSIWDWREWTEERCLIKPLFSRIADAVVEKNTGAHTISQLRIDDCVLCEDNRNSSTD